MESLLPEPESWFVKNPDTFLASILALFTNSTINTIYYDEFYRNLFVKDSDNCFKYSNNYE
jgi:hypothetical protein